MPNVDLNEPVTTSVVRILVLMHVGKEHSAGHEIMEPYALVPGDLLVTQQPLAVPIEIVVLITNVLAVASITDVLAVMLSGYHDTGDSLTITSHHSFKN